MKSNSGTISGVVLGLTVLAGLLTATAAARAQDTAQNCEVPDYLLSSESALPKVAGTTR